MRCPCPSVTCIHYTLTYLPLELWANQPPLALLVQDLERKVRSRAAGQEKEHFLVWQPRLEVEAAQTRRGFDVGAAAAAAVAHCGKNLFEIPLLIILIHTYLLVLANIHSAHVDRFFC